MTSDQQHGLNTPPFGAYSASDHGSGSGGSGPYGPPTFGGGHPPVEGYRGADFPAPAGVEALRPAAAGTKSRPRRGLAGTLVASSLAAVIGAGAGVGSYAYLTDAGGSNTSTISVSTVSAANSPVLDGTVSAAAARIDPSVVTITVLSGQSGDIGSGVVLDTAGHILTNDHVVAAAVTAAGGGGGGGRSTITVTLPDGRTAPATVVGTSETNDLAVIKVDGLSDLKPATFARSGSLKVGQAVVAAGAPLGLSESVTSGIVSNTARPVRSGNNNDAVYLAVQTDAAINPGNSGGPLVDLNGTVVGINSSIASTSSGGGAGGQAGNIGIGFSIPADVATRVAGDLIASGHSRNAALGVRVANSDTQLSTTTGVALETVDPSSAAAKAGLQSGDVVRRLNGFDTPTADALIAATRFYAPGTSVTLTYTRGGGSPRTAQVTLGTA